MTNRDTVNSIEAEFFKLIEDKTSWGRNELKGLFNKAVANHFIKVADKGTSGTVLKKRKVKTVTEEFNKPKVFRKRRK